MTARSAEIPRTAVLVVSPHSGRAGRRLPEAESLLQREGIKILETIPVSQADRLGRWADGSGDGPLILAAGGDGTIGTVAGHLVNTGAILGILPVGTSNDIARSLGIPMAMPGAVSVLRRGQISAVDVGTFQAHGARTRHFLHAATIGLNVSFARLATQPSLRKRLGPFTYAAAAVLAVGEMKPFTCELERDGSRNTMRLLQLTVINAPVFGGLLSLQVPGSRLDDHRLDVLAIEDMPLHRVVRATITMLRGKRSAAEGLTMFSVQQLRVHAGDPLDASLDGEIAGRLPGEFSISAGALLVVHPVS